LKSNKDNNLYTINNKNATKTSNIFRQNI